MSLLNNSYQSTSELWRWRPSRGYLTLSTLPAGLIVTKLAENICDGLCNHVPNCQDCWESGLLKKQPKSPQLLGVWVSGYGSWPRPMAFLIPLHSAPQPMGDQQHFLPNKTITPYSQVKKKNTFPSTVKCHSSSSCMKCHSPLSSLLSVPAPSITIPYNLP